MRRMQPTARQKLRKKSESLHVPASLCSARARVFVHVRPSYICGWEENIKSMDINLLQPTIKHYVTKKRDERVGDIARKHKVPVAEVVRLNRTLHPEIRPSSKS